jgi:hypothetical protein
VSAGLPAGAARRFADGRPRPVTVRVGGVVARRYDGVLTDARRLSLLVVATDRGDVAVACERPPAGPLPARLCDGILGSLRLVGARPLAPGPDPVLARGLDAALGPLAGARSQAALDDTNLARRADNLRRLAAATGAAAAAIRALTPRAADRPAVTRARAALAVAAQAHTGPAAAALDRLRAAYGTASAAVEAAQRRLRDALRELGRRGYRFAATSLP